jgi:uncharacterized protein YoxC
MQSSLGAIAVLLGALSCEASLRTATDVTPLGKVIQMLDDMAVKGQKEKNEEEVKFAAFSQWCSNQEKIKTDEITEGEEQMEMLSATIQKADARIRALTDRVHELEEDVGRWQKDKKSASTVRQNENADYTSTAQDYSESIDALTEAIAVLKKQSASLPQADLIQTVAKVHSLHLVPIATKKALAAFLQQAQPEELSYEAPEAHAYDFQSGGVIEMLEKLKVEFRGKKTDLDKEEMNAQHSYQQIMQILADNIENAEHEASNKRKAIAETQQLKAETEGNLKQTTADRDEDAKYKSEMVALCKLKTADFESRQKLRAQEISALKEAVQIMRSQTVSGTAEKNLPALLQYRKERTSFAQLRSSDRNPAQQSVAAFLADRAKNIDSRLLSLVAQRCAADPFTKVKKMIKDLISKLMEESTAETEHKGWCDTELTTNKQTRDTKSEEVNKLKADVEDLNAQIAQLTQDVEDLSSAVSELSNAMAKQTQERNDSKAQNEQTITEAKEAQAAVTSAIAILKEYYAKSAEATAFTQVSHKKQAPAEDAPETFDAPYKGQLPEGGSVVDFLQVILSDFARLEAETSSAEATEQENYEKYMFESKKDKALKENEIEHKENTKVDKESDLHSTERDLKSTQEQLDKAIAYYEKLKPTCVDSGITYEERVQRREQEIQSLQEALKILAGTDIA